MNTPRGRTSDTGIKRFGEMRCVSGNNGKRIWGNKIGTFGVFPVFFKQKALPKTLIPLVGEDRIMGNKRFAGAWKEGKRYYRYMYGLLARRRRKILAIL